MNTAIENYKIILILCLVGVIFLSCQGSSSVEEKSLAYEEPREMRSHYKDLYMCFGIDSVLKKDDHLLLVAGDELGIMHAFFIYPSLTNENYRVEIYLFKLGLDTDSMAFSKACAVDYIVHNRIEFFHWKDVLAEKKVINSLLKELDKAESEEKFMRNSFYIELCNCNKNKEIKCATRYKGGDSFIEIFFNSMILK